MSHFTCLRVVEGARLEIGAGDLHRTTSPHLNTHLDQLLTAIRYLVGVTPSPSMLSGVFEPALRSF